MTHDCIMLKSNYCRSQYCFTLFNSVNLKTSFSLTYSFSPPWLFPKGVTGKGLTCMVAGMLPWKPQRAPATMTACSKYSSGVEIHWPKGTESSSMVNKCHLHSCVYSHHLPIKRTVGILLLFPVNL